MMPTACFLSKLNAKHALPKQHRGSALPHMDHILPEFDMKLPEQRQDLVDQIRMWATPPPLPSPYSIMLSVAQIALCSIMVALGIGDSRYVGTGPLS